MNTLWEQMSKSERYRKQFVSSTAKRAFAFQLRAIMKKRGLSQDRLAAMCGLSQGVISRAADPDYGKLTVTIKTKIANGLDMAYLGTLVPYSDIDKWFSGLSEEAVQVPTFKEEMAVIERAEREKELASYKRAERDANVISIEAIRALAGKPKQTIAGGKLDGSDNDPEGQSASDDGTGFPIEWRTGTNK